MSKIFMSYRRSGTSGYAGRLYENLGAAFGKKNIFMDLDDIVAGKEFATVIESAVATHDTLLVLIGSDWLTTTGSDGQRRLFDPEDFVHKEIVAALENGLNIIPVLVKGATVPTAEQLPDPLKPLADRQAHEISDSRWDYDVEKLVQSLGSTTIGHRIRRSKWPRRLALFMAFMAVTFGAVMFATRGVTGDAEEFLALLAQNKIEEAYELTAGAFRISESLGSFEQYVSELGLRDNASASWTSRSVENSQATLIGNITTKQRTNIPLTLVMLKEDGMWRVLSLQGPRAGNLDSTGSPGVPDETELRELIKMTMLNFDRSVQTADFSDFHGSASTPLQREVTSSELLEIFGKFVDNQISIGAIADVDAVLDKAPTIDERGVLTSSGYYPTEEMNVAFELGFLYEHPSWTLAQISVQTLPPGEVP